MSTRRAFLAFVERTKRDVSYLLWHVGMDWRLLKAELKHRGELKFGDYIKALYYKNIKDLVFQGPNLFDILYKHEPLP